MINKAIFSLSLVSSLLNFECVNTFKYSGCIFEETEVFTLAVNILVDAAGLPAHTAGTLGLEHSTNCIMPMCAQLSGYYKWSIGLL